MLFLKLLKRSTIWAVAQPCSSNTLEVMKERNNFLLFTFVQFFLVHHKSPSQGHIYYLRHRKVKKLVLFLKISKRSTIRVLARPCSSNTLEVMKERNNFPLFAFQEGGHCLFPEYRNSRFASIHGGWGSGPQSRYDKEMALGPRRGTLSRLARKLSWP